MHVIRQNDLFLNHEYLYLILKIVLMNEIVAGGRFPQLPLRGSFVTLPNNHIYSAQHFISIWSTFVRWTQICPFLIKAKSLLKSDENFLEILYFAKWIINIAPCILLHPILQ